MQPASARSTLTSLSTSASAAVARETVADRSAGGCDFSGSAVAVRDGADSVFSPAAAAGSSGSAVVFSGVGEAEAEGVFEEAEAVGDEEGEAERPAPDPADSVSPPATLPEVPP
ncbi:hypothetical protein NGM37_48400, partial [Streptomyces sp. TRM76130]|nr:hypothetical protein [Streptomyces sp. TRM76130]